MVKLDKQYYVQKKPTRIGAPSAGLSDIGGVKITSMTIAPLNTNVGFGGLGIWNPMRYPGLSAISDVKIPEKFNWKDDEEKGQLITRPPNQMLCGSCWAFAMAGAISDNFVVTGLVDYIPNISATSFLICPNGGQLGCNGGNPAGALDFIANNKIGVATNHCIDYSWCATNQYCNGDAEKHMDVNKGQKKDPENTEGGMNFYMPKNCGCYDNEV